MSTGHSILLCAASGLYALILGFGLCLLRAAKQENDE